jgi:tight adherence protein B
VPVDRAVLDLAASVPGPDARLVAAILGLHQRSGGDAPAVLDRVARTLRERRASAREVRSLTAQARLSGAILGFLPVGFFLFLSVTARSDVEHALTSSTGRAAIIAGVLMQGTAFLWIRHLLRVDA